MGSAKASFIPVFHAYIPLGFERSIEERFLFEYLAGSLYPLLRVFEGLENERIDYGFTLSLSPILAGMLENPSLMLRFADYIDWQIEVAQSVGKKIDGGTELSNYYKNKFKDLKYWHVQRYLYRPLKAIFNLAALGNLEVIFSNAGNGILPVLEGVEASARAEVRAAVSEYERFTEGAKLKGILLTELAYSSGNEEILASEGIEYFFVDESGFRNATIPVISGNKRPVIVGDGVVAFAVNKKLSGKVGLEEMAYCYDGNFADKNSTDLTELCEELIPNTLVVSGGGSCKAAFGVRSRDGNLYSPQIARGRADKQATHYLSVLCDDVVNNGVEDGVIVTLIDHENVGRGWQELPIFVDMLLRKMRYDQNIIRSRSAGKYLQEERDFQIVDIGDSSNYEEGIFSEFYRSEREKYLPEIHLAAVKLESAIFSDERVGDQMARELMLASGCEWRYYSRKGIDEEYARERQRKRLARFAACDKMLGEAGVDLDLLQAIEERCSVLGTVGIHTFNRK